MDREKVIKELEERIKVAEECMGNPMFTPDAMRTIIALLKEQEAVKPYVTGRGDSFETAETWWYACENCHEALDPDDKYCRHCGREVLWHD